MVTYLGKTQLKMVDVNVNGPMEDSPGNLSIVVEEEEEGGIRLTISSPLYTGDIVVELEAEQALDLAEVLTFYARCAERFREKHRRWKVMCEELQKHSDIPGV